MLLGWELACVPILIAFNAFFVAAEYALVATRTAQVEVLRRQGYRGAAASLGAMKDRMSSAIGATQVGITLVSLLLGWVGEPAMSSGLEHLLLPLGVLLPQRVWHVIATAVGFLVVTILTVVLSELLPKALTLQHSLIVARFTAVPMLLIMRFMFPLVWVMNGMANGITKVLGLGAVEIEGQVHSAEEIGLITAEAGEAGILTPRERSLILNSLALGRKTAEQIMVPRVRVAHLDLTRSMEENMKVMNQYLFSRMPLCNGGMDKVVGVVYTKEFLTAFQEPGADSSVLSLIARPAVFVPVNVALDRLVPVFREKRAHMVFLVDEYGGVEGLVTISDVVDELLGSVEDAAPTRHAGSMAATLIVKGATPLHELAAKIRRDDWGQGLSVKTVGGLLSAELGHVPRAGEEVIVHGVRLRVLDSTRRRVGRVRVQLI
jgi:CBS domain containing-hemolysin-like protein